MLELPYLLQQTLACILQTVLYFPKSAVFKQKRMRTFNRSSKSRLHTCLDHIVYTGARNEEKQAAARLISSYTLTPPSRTCTHAHTHAYSHTHTHTRTCTHTQSLCICRSLQRGEASSSACDQAATFLNFASAAAGPAVQAACQGSGDPDQPGMMFSGDKLVPLASWKGASLGPDVRFGSTVTAVHYNSRLFINAKRCSLVFSALKALHRKH